MEGLSTTMFLSLSILYLMVNYVRSELSMSAEECRAMGFNRNNLLCSSCTLLPQYDLDILRKHCDSCCIQDPDGSSEDGDDGSKKTKVKRYPKARLEVCGWKLGSFPQVQAFVKSERPGKFSNFEVKYMGGQMPQIKLIEADDTVAETLSITKWDTDTIEEFLQTYLEPATPDPNLILDDDDDDEGGDPLKNEL